MWENKKAEYLETIAWVWAIFGSIFSLVGSIVIWASEDDNTLVGILVLVFGVISSLTMFFVLCGIAEIVENSTILVEQTKKSVKVENNKSKTIPHYGKTNDINEARANECPNCFSKITKDYENCPNCGYKLKTNKSNENDTNYFGTNFKMK